MTFTKTKIIKYISLLIMLTVCYFLVSATLALAFGVKLIQPFQAASPITIILSDPMAAKPYSKKVNPSEIQKLLDGHTYSQPYMENVFDCSDMSRETAKFLQADGYHTSVIGDDRDGKSGHAWAFVWVDKNSGWTIETATDVTLARGSAGEVIGDDWWDLVYTYEHDKANFVKDWQSGRGFEFYYPSIKRSGLHVFEWDDPSLDDR